MPRPFYRRRCSSPLAGTAPAAILTTGPDHFFALASIVADEMYGQPIPIVALPPADFANLRSGQWLEMQADGAVVIHSFENSR